MTDVVVRRRSGVMAVAAVASGAVSIGYLGRWLVADDPMALVIALALLAIALVHGLAWLGARHPLFVADATGVRVRLAGGWAGLPWESVERIDVEERGRLGDGRVTVSPRPGSLAASSLRARLAVEFNRRVHDAPLVVSYGLTTTESVVDVAGSLERLAAGLAPVVRASDPAPAPEPTVELTGTSSAPRAARPEPRPASAPVVAATAPTRTGRPFISVPIRPAARRDEVVVAAQAPAPPTLGGLALSLPDEDADAVELPEIDALRRRSAEDEARLAEGNVSLIIDATTDLSARAMQRARRLTEPATPPPRGAEPIGWPDADAPHVLLIGGELAAARQRLGMSVDDLAARTRIRPYVLEHFEIDDFSPCGGDFYARGHLRTVARVLGIDPAPLIENYDEYFASSPVNPREVFEAELAGGQSGFVRGGERRANWVALVAVVLLLALVWGVAKFVTDGVDDTPGTTTPASGLPLGSPGPGNPPATPRVAHVQVAVAGGDTHVVVRDRFKQIVFSGRLTDGDARKFEGEAPLRVVASDGGLVTLSSRGRDLGVMGEPGAAARQRVFAGS